MAEIQTRNVIPASDSTPSPDEWSGDIHRILPEAVWSEAVCPDSVLSLAVLSDNALSDICLRSFVLMQCL